MDPIGTNQVIENLEYDRHDVAVPEEVLAMEENVAVEFALFIEPVEEVEESDRIGRPQLLAVLEIPELQDEMRQDDGTAGVRVRVRAEGALASPAPAARAGERFVLRAG